MSNPSHPTESFSYWNS
ncbi:MAG: hypothetical protein ACFFD8_06300 [Candidatus Thorarchaeota archaeon]